MLNYCIKIEAWFSGIVPINRVILLSEFNVISIILTSASASQVTLGD